MNFGPEHRYEEFHEHAPVVQEEKSADAFGAMYDGLFRGEPLGQGMFSHDDYFDIVSAAETMIEDGEQTVGIGRQIDPDDIGLLVDDMIEEAGVLVGEPIMILLPDMGNEQIIQGRDRPAPGQFTGHLQPFGILAEHRVDDADKGFVAGKEAMSAGEQVSFEPSFALVCESYNKMVEINKNSGIERCTFPIAAQGAIWIIFKN